MIKPPIVREQLIARSALLNRIKFTILNNKITNIYGEAGCGKTTLSTLCLDTFFKDASQIILSSNTNFFKFDFRDDCFYIFEDFDSWKLNKEILDFIKSSNKYIKFIFITRNKINFPTELFTKSINYIQITPFSKSEIEDLILKRTKQNSINNLNFSTEKLLTLSGGNPLFINLMIDFLISNNSLMNSLLSTNSSKKIYKSCIVDAQGNPIDKTEKSTQIIVSDINDQLLFELSQNPNLLYNLSPYDFERVIAKMFEKKGFSVKITPKTRDGGKDIFIAKNDLCSFLFYVECKKYAPNRPVGIDVIQRLYGVVSAEKATGGIIATTSHFTKSAKSYVQEHKLDHQITLQDYDTITNILKTL